MTEQTTQPEAQAGPVAVTPPADSKLEQLHALYGPAKERAEAATAELKQITDAIKAELQAATGNAERAVLSSPYGPPLALTYSESWRVDAKKLKADRPDVYVLFAKQSGSWSLRPASGGGQ